MTGISIDLRNDGNVGDSLTACPAAPNNMSLRRPNRSMVKMAMNDARKYSVPLQAARRRLRKLDRPMLFSKIVAA